MQVQTEKLPKYKIRLTVTIEATSVKEAYQKALNDVVANAELPGYRKGHAPVELVKEKVDQQKFNNEVASILIRTYYPQAIKQENLTPIVSPKIEVDHLDPEKEFVFHVETALQPPVELGDYKKAIASAYVQKGKKPGFNPSDVVEAVISVTKVEIPDMVVDEEVNRMLARLVNQLQSLSLKIEDYLKSVNKTADTLRLEYAEIAKGNVAGEMALIELVKLERVDVDDKEIDATIEASGDTKLKEQTKNSPAERSYIKAIIAKNKLLWKLISDVEGEPKEKEKEEKKDDLQNAK